ncbi:NIPSNAP family protein [Ulvibacterium marinum]|uniref:NIPSNAP family containing protein n=1 Tax=Ulvibacterium marinum TaxID=2419782 RepID=A0A3B0C9C5_9FLAO|nr:NIPSNAP family protein [Ulvibacterium marinum]RKN81521.1 NIPSNAP family containing protein [Ulvibacterium marinum]
MKKIGLFVITVIFSLSLHAQAREYYQLKIYSFETDAQQQTTDDYLKTAFLPSLKRLGIQNVGVFKPHPTDEGTPKQTYVLIPFKSIVEFGLLDDTLAKDKTHQETGKTYLEAAHDKAPYTRIESIFMKAFVDMPQMEPSKLEGPRKDRIYELRSYEAATENLYRKKVDMFNAGGEVNLFDQLDFNAVFYAEVLSGANMPNLIYMTTHANREIRDSNWKAFVESAEWEKLKVMPKYQNTVSRNDTRLLYPTEYSDY